MPNNYRFPLPAKQNKVPDEHLRKLKCTKCNQVKVILLAFNIKRLYNGDHTCLACLGQHEFPDLPHVKKALLEDMEDRANEGTEELYEEDTEMKELDFGD